MFLYLGSIWALGLGSIWALFGLYLGSTLGLVVFGVIQVQKGLDKYLDQRIARGRLRPRSDAAPFANVLFGLYLGSTLGLVVF